MSEEALKELGEELARAAVDSEMSASQLQTIYRLVKTKPLAYVEAHLKRQLSRVDLGKAGFKKALDILGDYRADKTSLEKIMMYAVMLYDYLRRKPEIDLEVAAEPIIRRILNQRGCAYKGLKIELSGGTCRIEVKTSHFHGHLGQLAREIKLGLSSDERFSGLNLNVWINERR